MAVPEEGQEAWGPGLFPAAARPQLMDWCWGGPYGTCEENWEFWRLAHPATGQSPVWILNRTGPDLCVHPATPKNYGCAC